MSPEFTGVRRLSYGGIYGQFLPLDSPFVVALGVDRRIGEPLDSCLGPEESEVVKPAACRHHS